MIADLCKECRKPVFREGLPSVGDYCKCLTKEEEAQCPHVGMLVPYISQLITEPAPGSLLDTKAPRLITYTKTKSVICVACHLEIILEKKVKAKKSD